MNLTPAIKDYLLICLLRSESLMQLAAPKLKINYFDKTVERHYAIIWAAALDYYRLNNRLIHKQLLLVDIEQRIDGNPDWQDSRLIGEIEELVKVIYEAKPTDIADNYASEILSTFLKERTVIPLLSSNKPLDTLIPEIVQSNALANISTVPSIDVFDLNDPTLHVASPPRRPTGFDVFDVMMNGGPRKGDFIVILGPLAGGKTMVSILTAIKNVVTNNEWTAYFSYEQPIIPEVRERIWVAATGIERKEIEGRVVPSFVIPDDIPESERPEKMTDKTYAAIVAASTRIRKLRTFDMSGTGANGRNGIDDVESVLQQEASQGRRMGAVFIDWAGLMAQRYAETRNITLDSSTLSILIAGIGDRCKQLATKYGCWVVLMHQLKAIDGKKTATGTAIDQYAASGCSMIGTQATCVITISGANKEDMICKIANPKARCGGDGSILVKIDSKKHQMAIQYDLVLQPGTDHYIRKDEVQQLTEMAKSGNLLKQLKQQADSTTVKTGGTVLAVEGR